MTILYLISSLNYGGAEKQTVLDASIMVPGNEVFLIYFIDGPLREILAEEVHLIHLKKNNYLITAIRLAQQIKKNKIQIIHCSLFASMIISTICSLFCKIEIIWHFHSHEYKLPRFHRMAYKWLAHIPAVKKICFVNKELIQYFHKIGFNFPRHKIKLLYNNATIQPSIEKKKENNNIIIGYTGRLVSLKRVGYLIELAQYLVSNKYFDFQIQIVGDGTERILLEQESFKKELQGYISFVGFQNDVEQYYRCFDLFVNPSQEECLSIALIDAGMCGIPSVAFDVGGNNEIIINTQTGYIVNSKEEFFEKILSLIKNKTLREAMGKKASVHCLKHFSEEIHLQQLVSLYKEVMG